MKWNDRIGRRLKLHDLHVLMTVAESGTMGRAAERLAVSPPSVSKAISDMEHAIGVRLLDRTAKGVEPTAYGRALLQHSVGAFEELRQAIKAIENLSDPSVGEVRIGCPDVFTSGLVSAILDHFSRRYPRVIVNVTAANNVAEEFRPLRDRAVDLVIAGFPRPLADDDLALEFLYEDRPYIVTGPGNPLARRRKVKLADLAEEPWLLPREGIFVSLLTEAFRKSSVPVPQLGVRSYSVHQRMTLLATDRFVSAEVGSVLHFNASRFPIKVLPIDLAISPWPVWLVTLKGRTSSPVVQTFIAHVRDVTRRMSKVGRPFWS
ncbi:MAG TPA: LysR family transcriptional regulator [Pseudolabrys sp.]|jgi:DNA-binding transcriptional LysR family regulator